MARVVYSRSRDRSRDKNVGLDQPPAWTPALSNLADTLIESNFRLSQRWHRDKKDGDIQA